MAVNGLYIVQGESNAVVALLRKSHRGWSHHQQQLLASHLDDSDPLLRNFADLREVLNKVTFFFFFSALLIFLLSYLEVINDDRQPQLHMFFHTSFHFRNFFPEK